MKYKLNDDVLKSKKKSVKTRDKVLFHKYLVNLLAINENSTVLDLGCGHGNTLLYIAEKLGSGGKAVGVDIDESLLAVAEKLLDEKKHDTTIDLYTADLQRPLPFKNNSFDRIVCHNVLECIPNKVAFINRSYKLLKRGGIMIMSHSDWDSQIYNSSLPELSRRLIHSYSDTTQSWMTDSDGTIGRKLKGIFKNTKFTTFSSNVYLMKNDTFKQQDYGFRIAQDIIKIASESNKFSKKDLKMWIEDLKEKDKNSDFFYSSNINLVIATK